MLFSCGLSGLLIGLVTGTLGAIVAEYCFIRHARRRAWQAEAKLAMLEQLVRDSSSPGYQRYIQWARARNGHTQTHDTSLEQ